ncbi:MAG: tol-pal system protein YbgF [candidate division Zixibacteria bacterium]|nr:tol-pal system protein YbgF [candidate division Zixibacteria bacterium]
MMKRYWVFMILALAIMVSGCATRRQMAETKIEIDWLRHEHREIMAAMTRIDSLLVAQNVGSKKLNAELKMSMSALEERMLLVESRLEDAGMLVNRAVETMEMKQPAPQATDSSDTTQAVGQVDHQKVYNMAYLDLTKGHYKLAIKGFEDYLESYSKTSLADNAVYWIGECHYILKNYPKSQKWYEKLINEYPKSEHMASARLKFAMSMYNQRYKTKSKQYFQDVVKDYPGTEEANQAAEMLRRYK